MWRWRLEWNEIRRDLVVGSCPRETGDLARLKGEAGISAVLSLQHDICHGSMGIDYASLRTGGNRLGLLMARSPMRDFDPEAQRRCLPDALLMLHRMLIRGHRVYVHCTAGINRSPLTVLAYLHLVEGQPMEAALGLILRRRPSASPCLQILKGCRRDLIRRFSAPIGRRKNELTPWLPPLKACARAEQEVLREVFLSRDR